MAATNLNVYMPVVILMVVAVLMVVGGHLVSVLLSPKSPDSKGKQQSYECGEDPVGVAWSAFNVRFYVVGLIFIIFDVESVLMFPIAAVFRQLNEHGYGAVVLAEVLIFLFVLVAGIAYCWRKGDLDWVKSYTISK